MTIEPRSKRRRSVFVLAAFLYFWLIVAAAVATLAVLGPVQWLADSHGSRALTGGMWVLMTGLILVVSFLIGRWLLRRTLLSRTRLFRAGIPVLLTLLALLSAWAWVNGTATSQLAPEDDGTPSIVQDNA